MFANTHVWKNWPIYVFIFIENCQRWEQFTGRNTYHLRKWLEFTRLTTPLTFFLFVFIEVYLFKMFSPTILWWYCDNSFHLQYIMSVWCFEWCFFVLPYIIIWVSCVFYFIFVTSRLLLWPLNGLQCSKGKQKMQYRNIGTASYNFENCHCHILLTILLDWQLLLY